MATSPKAPVKKTAAAPEAKPVVAAAVPQTLAQAAAPKAEIVKAPAAKAPIAKTPAVKPPAVEPTAPKAAAPKAPVAQAPAAKAAPAAAPVAKAAPAADPMAVFLKPFGGMPEQMRANTEKGIEQFRSQYATLKSRAETATDRLEESVSAAQAGTRQLHARMVEAFRAQSSAGFELMKAVLASKSIFEAVQLQQDFAKAQMAALQTQSREFADLANKIAQEVGEPVKASVSAALAR